MTGRYFIRRHNAFFLAGAHGYTVYLAAAGIFDEKTAKSYLDVEGLTIHPLVEYRERAAAEIIDHETELAGLRAVAAEIAAASPCRIRLSRKRGWRKPPDTIVVARPSKWGNPMTLANAIESGYTDAAGAQAFVVECFRDWIGPSKSGRDWWSGPGSDRRRKVFIEDIAQLRGKNLACWCPLDQPCHADVLLELANR